MKRPKVGGPAKLKGSALKPPEFQSATLLQFELALTKLEVIPRCAFQKLHQHRELFLELFPDPFAPDIHQLQSASMGLLF